MVRQSPKANEPKIIVLPKSQAKPSNPRYITTEGALSPIQRVVEVMMVVNTKSPEAQLNATSISDNNGGRIQLNDPTVPQPDFKKITGS